MSTTKALLVGLRRGVGHPLIIVLMWLAGLLTALPAAVMMTETLHASWDKTVIHDEMRKGFDMGWYAEFDDRTDGLAETFRPGVTGGGAFLRNLESWLQGKLHKQPFGLLLSAGIYGCVWLLLQGGILSKFDAQGKRFGWGQLFGAGAGLFLRFLRLALLAAPLYIGIYWIQSWLYGRLQGWTQDITAERPILLYSMVVLGLTALMLALVQMSFDYAKIATVVEERRSMLLAAGRGLRFVFTHPLQTIGLYLALGLISAIALTLYTWLAPGAGQASWASVLIAFAIGQAFLVLRLILRVALLGGEFALYRELTTERHPAEGLI